jgi:hypothetical protein
MNNTPDDNKITVRQGAPSGRAASNHDDTTAPVPATDSTSPDSGESTIPPQKPPKKSRKWLLIAAAIVVLVVGSGVAYYLLVMQPTGSKTTDDPLAAATKFSSPQELVSEVKPTLNGTVMLVAVGDGVSAETADGYGVYSAPSYLVPGKKFLSLPEAVDGAGYKGDSVAAAANYRSLVEFFETNKFKKIVENDGGVAPISAYDTGVYVAYAEYESSDMLCAIRHADASQTGLKAHISGIGCAEKASYRAAADKLQPFYDAYADGESYKEPVLLGGLVIQPGADGYQNAVVYIEDSSQFEAEEENQNYSFKGLYYKAQGESKWIYYNGYEGDTSSFFCSSYDSDVLKKAFKGIGCYDDKLQKYGTVS